MLCYLQGGLETGSDHQLNSVWFAVFVFGESVLYIVKLSLLEDFLVR